jgi:hypothetical protein
MQAITTIGFDIAKSVFQVHGVDAAGQVIVRRQLKRRQVIEFFQKLPPCLVGIKACANGSRDHVEAGGLMSFGSNYPDLFRRAADFVDKILRGAKPADIPVEQPTKFDLVVNLTTAKALGLDVPPTLLARADEVIE